VYVRTSETDSVNFFNDKYRQIDIVPDPHELNPFNSRTCNYSVGNGDILIFPSDVPHGVPTVFADEPRISIAFNTFVRGTFGGERGVLEL
jgi:hypothetical protein